MAEKIELFELDVDYENILEQQAELIKLINRLKEDQKALVKDTNNLTTATDEQAAAFVENQNSIKALTADYNANNKVLTALNNTQTQNINSVEQARKALGDVSTLWARTTQIEGENSEASKKLAQRKLELTNRLKELEGATGDNTRNVGGYTDSILKAYEAMQKQYAQQQKELVILNNIAKAEKESGGVSAETTKLIEQKKYEIQKTETALKSYGVETKNASKQNGFFGTSLTNLQAGVNGLSNGMSSMPGPISSVGSGLKMVNAQFLALLANPIVLIIAGIVAAFVALYKAFKSTDAGGTELEARFAQVSAIMDVVRQRVAALASGIVNLFSGNWKQAAKDFSNAVKGGGEQLANATKAAYEYVYALDALEDAEDGYISKRAENENKIAKLEYSAQDRTKSTAERKKALEEAIKISEEEAKKNKQFADEKYDAEIKNVAARYNLKKSELDAFIKADDETQKVLLANNSKLAFARNDMNNKGQKALEEYYAKSIEADTKFFEENKRNNSKLSGFEKELEAERKAAADAAAKRREESNKAVLKNLELEKALFEAQNQSYLDGVDELNRELVDKELARLTEISTLDEAIDRQRLKNKEITQKEFDINQITRQNELNKTTLELNAQLYEQEQAQLYAEWEAQLAAEAEQNERLKALDEEFKAKEAERKLIDIENQRALAEMNLYTAYEFKKRELEEKYRLEIEAAEKVGADTALINQKYEKTKTQLARKEAAARLEVVNSFVGNIATLFGEGTKLGKLAAATQVSIDAIKGAFSAYSAAQALPPPVGQIVGAASAAAVLAIGVKKVKDIYAVKSGLPESGGGSVSTPSGGGYGGNSPIPQQVYDGGLTGSTSSGNVGQTIKTAMSEALSENQMQPVLVIDDVTAAQNVKSNIVSISSM